MLFGKDKSIIWAAGIGLDATKLIMQDDGNLVLYKDGDQSVWSTGTNNKCHSDKGLKLFPFLLFLIKSYCYTVLGSWFRVAGQDPSPAPPIIFSNHLFFRNHLQTGDVSITLASWTSLVSPQKAFVESEKLISSSSFHNCQNGQNLKVLIEIFRLKPIILFVSNHGGRYRVQPPFQTFWIRPCFVNYIQSSIFI